MKYRISKSTKAGSIYWIARGKGKTVMFRAETEEELLAKLYPKKEVQDGHKRAKKDNSVRHKKSKRKSKKTRS